MHTYWKRDTNWRKHFTNYYKNKLLENYGIWPNGQHLTIHKHSLIRNLWLHLMQPLPNVITEIHWKLTPIVSSFLTMHFLWICHSEVRFARSNNQLLVSSQANSKQYICGHFVSSIVFTFQKRKLHLREIKYFSSWWEMEQRTCCPGTMYLTGNACAWT